MTGAQSLCQVLRQPHGQHRLLRPGHIVRHAAEPHRCSIRIIYGIAGAGVAIARLPH